MTNGEKFADIFNKTVSDNYAVNRSTLEPVLCYGCSCDDCLWNEDTGCSYTTVKFVDWYNSEYKSPEKLSKRDKAFLDCMIDSDDAQIYRDDDGALFINDMCDMYVIELDSELFKFIRYGTSYYIEYLKTLEVEEND